MRLIVGPGGNGCAALQVRPHKTRLLTLHRPTAAGELHEPLEQMNTYTYVANLSELVPDIPADSIMSRTVYADQRLKAVLFGFAAGQELSEHTASQPAILHILQGQAHLTLGDDSLEARAGAWVQMPAQLRHSIHAKTPVVMLLLLIKTAILENPDHPPS